MEKKPAEASAPQADQHNENSSHFEGAVILVVDDEPLQRDQTQVAASAEEALIITRTLKPDVVLTDLRMYKMDGIELMEKLRSQTDAPEVIIMSAFGTPVIIEKSLKKGAFSFMTKPLDITQVLFNINKALEITAKVKYSDQRFHEKWR
jgi:DNA-binding NtrC family response regulator